MTGGQRTRLVSNGSLAPAPLAALLAAALVGGAIAGAATKAQPGSTDTSGAAIVVAAQPAATCDAVKSPAEEHGALVPQPDPGANSSERGDRIGGR